MSRIKMSAPWDVFYNEINELFREDSDVTVVYDEDTKEIKLYVQGQDKATALNDLLPTHKTYGNVTQKITITPANGFSFASSGSNIYKIADVLRGNGAVSRILTVSGAFSNPITYVAFINKVVQYFNDDIGDINGQCSTLYQEIAKDVFGELDGIYFCTDRPFEYGSVFKPTITSSLTV